MLLDILEAPHILQNPFPELDFSAGAYIPQFLVRRLLLLLRQLLLHLMLMLLPLPCVANMKKHVFVLTGADRSKKDKC